MDLTRPMKIVLIEDDIFDCKQFTDCAAKRGDINFVGITASSDEGLSFVQNKLPEAVILDLELNRGSGSGTDFLKKFYQLDLPMRPLIVVTTRNRSQIMHTKLHEDFTIEWIFSKEQQSYSADMVIEQLLDLRPFLHKQRASHPDLVTLETPEELEKRIMERISAEMDAFGISPKYKGRRIAEESIYRLIHKKIDGDSEYVFKEIALARGKHYNNIVRPLESAILQAWTNPVDLERLLMVYTAPVRSEVGAPTPTEFIHYYADKIRRDL